GKYFVSVNLPELPSGVYWRGSIAVMDKNNSYIFNTVRSDLRLKTGQVNVEVVPREGMSMGQVQSATLSLAVFNEKGDMVSHTLSLEAPNQVLRQSSVQTDDSSWDAFNTTGIFNWK
ncbi:hypothetical protein IZY60_12730, partial [Lutibacter sp. B2]|nr:hypothetical protein [Lutibacter sp. B2]